MGEYRHKNLYVDEEIERTGKDFRALARRQGVMVAAFWGDSPEEARALAEAFVDAATFVETPDTAVGNQQ